MLGIDVKCMANHWFLKWLECIPTTSLIFQQGVFDDKFHGSTLVENNGFLLIRGRHKISPVSHCSVLILPHLGWSASPSDWCSTSLVNPQKSWDPLLHWLKAYKLPTNLEINPQWWSKMLNGGCEVPSKHHEEGGAVATYCAGSSWPQKRKLLAVLRSGWDIIIIIIVIIILIFIYIYCITKQMSLYYVLFIVRHCHSMLHGEYLQLQPFLGIFDVIGSWIFWDFTQLGV